MCAQHRPAHGCGLTRHRHRPSDLPPVRTDGPVTPTIPTARRSGLLLAVLAACVADAPTGGGLVVAGDQRPHAGTRIALAVGPGGTRGPGVAGGAVNACAPHRQDGTGR